MTVIISAVAQWESPAQSAAKRSPEPNKVAPIMSFAELDFADEGFRQHVRLFHDLAERQAGEKWHRQSYRDEPGVWPSRYMARWQDRPLETGENSGSDIPGRSIFITLRGDGKNSLRGLKYLNVHGFHLPEKGWGAFINYGRCTQAPAAGRPALQAWVKLANRGGPAWRTGLDDFCLTDLRVLATIQLDDVTWTFEAVAPDTDFRLLLKTLYDSPEALRNDCLARITTFRKETEERIHAGKQFTYLDNQVRTGDDPPREQPAEEELVTEKIKQAIRQQVDQQLDQQEKVIRENYREIHAAVQRALPLADLKKSLLEYTPVPSNR